MSSTLRNPPTVIVGTDVELGDELVHRIHTLLDTKGVTKWSLAIPGGSVAERLLPGLANASLPWSGARVFFVDERAVAPDAVESNWRLCRETTAGTPMASATWHRMTADADPLVSASAYAQLLKLAVGSSMELDVVLL